MRTCQTYVDFNVFLPGDQTPTVIAGLRPEDAGRLEIIEACLHAAYLDWRIDHYAPAREKASAGLLEFAKPRTVLCVQNPENGLLDESGHFVPHVVIEKKREYTVIMEKAI